MKSCWRILCLVGAVFFSTLTLVSTCTDKDNVTMPCDLNQLDGVTCTYIKAKDPVLPGCDGQNCPTKVKYLKVDTVMKKESCDCNTYLNITWGISQLGGGYLYLTGFLLNVSFVLNNTPRTIIRVFNLSVSNWSNPSIFTTAFRHEAITPAANTSYDIRLHSLPLSQLADEDNSLTVPYQTSSFFNNKAPCDPPSDPNITYNWAATMWSTKDDSTLEVCFFTAPPVFGFTVYKLYLLDYNSTDGFNTKAEREINTTGNMDRKVCQRFTNLCTGVYRVYLMPLNLPEGQCVCRAGPNDCRDYCYRTDLSPLHMTTSRCLPPTMPPAVPVLPSTTPRDDEWDAGKIAGTTIGIIAGLSVTVLLFLVIYLRLCRVTPESRFKLPITIPEPPGPEIKVENRQSVLIVYSADTEHHRKVIHKLAAFLHSCCQCDVRYDDWSHVDIARSNSFDWLTRQLHQVNHVIIVNSHGGYEQHRSWVEGKRYVPTNNLLLPDMFIPAIRQLQTAYFLNDAQYHYYHVFFPYTDSKHVLSVSFGQRYKLMDRIEDLFLIIHGMTKFHSKGTTMANQINAHNYMNYKEGQALKEAVNAATEYYRANPDWFQKYYRRDENPVEKPEPTFIYEKTDDQTSGNPSSRPSSISSTKDETKTSDFDNTSEIEFIPPFHMNDYYGDGERNSIVSPDFGIDELTDGSTTPVIYCEFSPLPPDDDDSSIGSRSFNAKVQEMNEQYDSGFPASVYDLSLNRSSC